jgi:hypothetical protein
VGNQYEDLLGADLWTLERGDRIYCLNGQSLDPFLDLTGAQSWAGPWVGGGPGGRYSVAAAGVLVDTPAGR